MGDCLWAGKIGQQALQTSSTPVLQLNNKACVHNLHLNTVFK